MVYKLGAKLQAEVRDSLIAKGYAPTNPAKNVGITQALQSFQADRGILMMHLENSGKLCPMTAEALGIKVDFAVYKMPDHSNLTTHQREVLWDYTKPEYK